MYGLRLQRASVDPRWSERPFRWRQRVGASAAVEPDEDEERQLRMDWEELMDSLFGVERICPPRRGAWLSTEKPPTAQALVKPSAAPAGDNLTLPRGLSEKEFYRRFACPPFVYNTNFCLRWGRYNCCFILQDFDNVICMDNMILTPGWRWAH